MEIKKITDAIKASAPKNDLQLDPTKSRTLTQSTHSTTENSLDQPLCIPEYHSNQVALEHYYNPLISSAASIIAAVSLLQKNNHLDPEKRNTLDKYIKQFEKNARQKKYRYSVIMAAKYLLSSYIEIAAPDAIKKSKDHKEHDIKTPRFFLILERACEEPEEHIDLIELGYLLLQLGFSGNTAQGHLAPTQLENIRDNLRYIIRRTRGEPSEQTFFNTATQENRTQSKWLYITRWHRSLMGLFVLTMVTTTYTICAHQLDLISTAHYSQGSTWTARLPED